MTFEDLPPEIRLKLLRLQKKMLSRGKPREEERKDPRQIVLSVLSDEKAVEVLKAAEEQFSQVIDKVIEALAKYIVENNVKSIDAYELYQLFLALGLNVRLPLKIKVVKGGKEISFEDYIKEKE
ncbi:MAG: hypothetical protein J7J78_00400 [Thermoprotei archaeon]|nr:hypothetical protein [Thermoprotei archaeon]